MAQAIENKHYIANLSVIGFGVGIIETIRDIKLKEKTLSKTLKHKLNAAESAGMEFIKTFPAILSPKGEKRAYKCGKDFKIKHMPSASLATLLGISLGLADDLLEKEKPDGTKVLSDEQIKKGNVFIARLLAINKYFDRDLKFMKEYEIAGQLIPKWWETYYNN